MLCEPDEKYQLEISNGMARIYFCYLSNGKILKNILQLKNVGTLKEILNLWQCFV